MTPLPPRQRSRHFHELRDVELHFAETVRGFISGYSERFRPVVGHIVYSWCKTWTELPEQFPRSDPEQFRIFEIDGRREFWRRYYARNREHILQRQRRNYARRKAQQ